MEELLRFINEFDTKHTDQKWCEDFYGFVADNEESLENIDYSQLPISVDRFEEMMETVVNSVSRDFLIERVQEGKDKPYILLSVYKDIDYKTLTKYKDVFVEALKESSYLMSDAVENTDLLKFCIENGLDDLVNQFDNKAFTLSLLNEFKDYFIEYLRRDLENKNHLTDYGVSERLRIYDSVDFFKFCIENKVYKSLSEFFFHSVGMLTPQLLNEYKDLLVDVLEKSFYGYKDADVTVFNFCLENNLLNDQRILEFNESFYTKDILHQYKDKFAKALSKSYKTINNSDVLDFCFENNITSMINRYCLERLFFTKETFDRNKEGAISFFSSQTILNYDLKDNNDVFIFILENGITNCIDFYIKNKPELFTEELMTKYRDGMTKYFMDYDVPDIMRNNIDVIKFLINLGIICTNDDKELIIYKLDYLYNINDEVLSSINFDILKYDFDLTFLSKITLYGDIQKKIINLSDSELKIFYRIAKVINNGSIDLSSIIVKFLDNIANYEHILANVDVNNMSDVELKNFLEMISLNCNYGISDANDLGTESFRKKKQEYFENFGEKIGEHSIDEIKEAIFQKQYGIDYSGAKFILDRYGYDYEELVKSGLDEKVIKIIFGIKAIIDCESKEKLTEMYNQAEQVQVDYQVFANLESMIRKHYAEMYNKTYYKIDEHSKKCNGPFLENITYEGKPVEFYEVDGDFAMQIHALGAYRHFTVPEDFKDSWNRPKIAYHGICTSYISNSQIATARAFHPILGFSEYEDSALLLGGNYDLFSDDAIGSFDTSSFLPYKMLPPSVMIDATRHNHNEMVIERSKGKQTPGSYKRQPSYVVYIVDSMEESKNFDKDNSRFNETIQAAADFGIPVVIVDRTKISKQEMEKATKLEEEFVETHSLEALDRLLLTYFNNNVGGRFFTFEKALEHNNLFNDKAVNNMYARIRSFIMNNIVDDKEKLIILAKITDILARELSNYAVSHQSEKMPKPFDFEQEINNLKAEIEVLRRKIVSNEIEVEEEMTSGRSR